MLAAFIKQTRSSVMWILCSLLTYTFKQSVKK